MAAASVPTMTTVCSLSACPKEVDLGQRAAHATAGRQHLAHDVVVEAAQHRQLGQGFVGQLNRQRRMRQCGTLVIDKAGSAFSQQLSGVLA